MRNGSDGVWSTISWILVAMFVVGYMWLITTPAHAANSEPVWRGDYLRACPSVTYPDGIFCVPYDQNGPRVMPIGADGCLPNFKLDTGWCVERLNPTTE